MKFLEKHGLLKLVGIILLIAIVLTWLTPIASFSAGELITEDFQRVGLFDITTFGLLGFNYFPFIFIFLFIVGAFYGFLAKTEAYQELTNRIAKSFEEKAFLFTVVSMVVYGILSSIVVDYVVLFALVPFTLTIASKIKSTKLSAFISTFGGILLGILGCTLGGNVATSLKSTFNIANGAKENIAICIVFVIGAVILAYLAYEDQKKNGSKEEKLAKDLFAEEKKEEVKEVKGAKKTAKKVAVKKVNTLPLVIVYCVTMVLAILAFINWENISVSLFADINTYITEATIAGVPVFSYILGSTITAFGSWSLFGVVALMLVATIIISILYKISFNKIVDSYIEGMKNVGRIVGLVFIIYIVLETTYFFPVLPTIINGIYELLGNNLATWIIAPAVQTVFSVEFQYVMQGVGDLLSTIGSETSTVTALASQFAYGLVSFVAPTSVMLAAGLTMLGINIKEYFKFIWKFLVAMLVVIVIVLLILLLI